MVGLKGIFWIPELSNLLGDVSSLITEMSSVYLGCAWLMLLIGETFFSLCLMKLKQTGKFSGVSKELVKIIFATTNNDYE